MKRALLMIAALTMIGACENHPSESGYADRAAPMGDTPIPASTVGFHDAQQAGRGRSALALYQQKRASTALQTPSDPIGRMVTRTAEIRAVVTHPESTSAALSATVQAVGGFVEDARQWRASGQTLASLTLRVPDARLGSTLDAIKQSAIRIDNEAVTGTDVTGEYTDLGAQLKNLRATEAELRSLLVTVGQRTRKAEDVLDVFNQLTEVRGQIEQAEARMGTLSKLSELATIHVDLVPDALSQPIAQAGWRPLVTARGAFSDLLGTLRWATDALIWVMIYLVPIVISVGVPMVGLALAIRSLRRRWAPVRIS